MASNVALAFVECGWLAEGRNGVISARYTYSVEGVKIMG